MLSISRPFLTNTQNNFNLRVTTSKRGQHRADIAALELHEPDNNLVYGDDDY